MAIRPRGAKMEYLDLRDRRVVGVVEHLGDVADVLLPRRARHIADLAQSASALQPVALVN